jgi:hypothetical protein
MQSKQINEENKNGDCYVIAYREQGPKDILVHGLVTPRNGPLQNITYNHAWIERDDKVIDRTIQNKDIQEMDKDIYYALGQTKTTYKYTLNEVLEKSDKFQTYGPWEKELLESEF